MEYLGLLGLKEKVDSNQGGAMIRLLGVFGFLGLGGFFIPSLGACGAFGALGLYNHQNTTYKKIGNLGWLGLIGIAQFLFN